MTAERYFSINFGDVVVVIVWQLDLWRGVLDTILRDKVCEWLAIGQWFLVSSTNKTDLHDITDILLKVALNTITFFVMSSNSKIKMKDESGTTRQFTILQLNSLLDI